MANNYRWQVPGNANPFDSELKNWKENKMSIRTIVTLKVIDEANVIKIDDYVNYINGYLERKFSQEPNKSLIKHFYRPLEFLGMIHNDNDELSLTFVGKKFLKEIEEGCYENATDIYLKQLINSSYPNTATKHIKLSLYPYKIIFKLLLNEPIKIEWFRTKIPYIKNIGDLHNIENINNEPYEKWVSWVIKYLVIWGVLEKEEDYIILTDYKKEFIAAELENVTYEDCFI